MADSCFDSTSGYLECHIRVRNGEIGVYQLYGWSRFDCTVCIIFAHILVWGREELR